LKGAFLKVSKIYDTYGKYYDVFDILIFSKISWYLRTLHRSDTV